MRDVLGNAPEGFVNALACCLRRKPVAIHKGAVTVELLAPAKDLEIGIAAIDCGADAVYIGASQFGAREAASNSVSDIERLVDYAHRYWVKVYAAVNTLLRDEEIEPAVDLCHALHGAGVDGLIIQDVGLLECDLPPLPLIASTQMHNHTPERVAFLEKVGFQRAILARELDLQQIRNIRCATSTIELEAFVHGALCVCMSGQCTLSYAFGGRSGNRGQCAQPCRRSYALLDSADRAVAEARHGDRGEDRHEDRHEDRCKERHWLSLRDLNLSEHLGDLLAAGVTSFKIEGRLKNKAYVMNVVGHYRQTLDRLLGARGLRKSSSGHVDLGFSPNPDKTFNRGYTTYFLGGRGADVASPDSPKHVGEPIGKVASLGRDSFVLDQAPPLHSGDGITFYDQGRQLDGSVVNRVQGRTVFPQRLTGIAPGARVFRNHDHAFAADVAKSRPTRKIAIELRLRELTDGLALEATDEEGVSAMASVTCDKIPAEKPEQATELVTQHLGKLGETELVARQISLAWSRPVHLAASTINSLRRSLASELRKARAAARPVAARPTATAPSSLTTAHYTDARLTFLGNVLNRKAEAFYRRHGVTEIEPAAESGIDLHGRPVMTCRYCLKYQQGFCPRERASKPAPAEPWFLIDDQGRRLRLDFHCHERNCVMQVVFEGD